MSIKLVSALILIWAIFVNSPHISACQDSSKKETSEQLKVQDEFFKIYKKPSGLPDSIRTSPFLNIDGIPADLDSLTRLKYWENKRAEYQYNINGALHREKVFKWQLISSKLIFFVVIILVIMGIVFSGLQFKKGTGDSRTELEFSKAGIKVSSSILGVIILVISLMFFYLFLIYVYPIEEIF